MTGGMFNLANDNKSDAGENDRNNDSADDVSEHTNVPFWSLKFCFLCGFPSSVP